MEAIQQTFNGNADFNRKVTCTISRNGDLIHRMYLQVTLPAVTPASGTFGWCHSVGQRLINYVELEIGGQRIDRHYSQWMNIWSELTVSQGHNAGYGSMVGNTAALTGAHANTPQTTLYVPLEFWFCRNAGLALPLIALQYHEVKVNLQFESFANCMGSSATAPASTPSLADAQLYVDYIYLDTDERRRKLEYCVKKVHATENLALSVGKHLISQDMRQHLVAACA
jgi:hypothetical protein